MNNTLEQTKKSNVPVIVAGVVTSIAFVIMIFMGIKGIFDNVRNIYETIKYLDDYASKIIMLRIPSILLSLAAILSTVILAVYCALTAIRKGKKVKSLYIAGFVIAMLVSVFSVFSTLFNLISAMTQGLYSWHYTAAMIVSIVSSALTTLAFLLAAITGFVKKPKASRIIGIVAVVLIVICALLVLVNNGLNLFYVKGFFNILKIFVPTALGQLVRIVAFAGTILLLRPVKE